MSKYLIRFDFLVCQLVQELVRAESVLIFYVDTKKTVVVTDVQCGTQVFQGSPNAVNQICTGLGQFLRD